MVPGIYLVTFGRPGTSGGAKGVVVVEGDRVHGGDQSNLYRGRIEGEADSIRAKIRVTNHSGSPDTIFGPLKEFELEVAGEEVEGTFRLAGHIAGRPELRIGISGTWQQSLVD